MIEFIISIIIGFVVGFVFGELVSIWFKINAQFNTRELIRGKPK